MTSIYYQPYLRLIRQIRSSKILHQYLFGYRPYCKSEIYGAYWDWTTLILRKALRQHLRSDSLFLDMGTGSVGVLAIFASLRLGCRRVQAVDHIPEIVSSAKRNADSLHLNIEFYCSDLFSNVDGCFDMIAFNAPYLDFERGRDLGILEDRFSEMRFSGGRGGGETIARFLHNAPEHMSDGGTLLLGVSRYHMPRSAIQDLISSSGLELRECIESSFIPSSAYLLYQHHS